MEHRLCERTDVAADVVIYCCGTFTGRGRIRNLSRDGMFIECVPKICAANICVEVGFVEHGAEMVDMQRICGYVIHRSKHGIGLMLVMPSDAQLRRVNRLRREWRRAESSAATQRASLSS